LPQLGGDTLFVGDGGLETVMIFEKGFELPCFASFVMLEDEGGVEALREYYGGFLEVAGRQGVGFTLDTPTWRASSDWGSELGYSEAALAEANRKAVELGESIRTGAEDSGTPIALCGAIGPRGDAYQPASVMSADEAEGYHAEQIGTFSGTAADMVGAYTLCYADEAVGIVRAAGAARMPVSISFTVETDGRLPSGQGLGEAIEQVDGETGGEAAYFMINCAHPTHFADVVEQGGPWLERIGGIRANASRKSHEELDNSTELDAGDPDELGSECRALKPRLPNVRVLGGCCGTDHRHVDRVCASWLGPSGAGA
jgi:S-methylmethionine-dependent homocysteine/selenocysteine methylase